MQRVQSTVEVPYLLQRKSWVYIGTRRKIKLVLDLKEVLED